jgi:pimeloyl-ACP methyl ester carboxylesterase
MQNTDNATMNASTLTSWLPMPKLLKTKTATSNRQKSPPVKDNPLQVGAPSFALLALEMRAFWEFGAVLPFWPALMRAPRGDGHTVIVFPGLAASDATTIPIRRYLEALGHDVLGWEQGNNFGPRAGVLETAQLRVREAFEVSGKKVSLVGWSLGGIYAREIAKELPQCVRCVISLGTPFAGAPKSTNAWRLYEAVSGRDIDRESENYELHVAPPVPTTSVFSRTDGIVAWQGSIQPPQTSHEHTENIEVVASHFGIGLNPSAWWAVADRLAQPQDQWKPFAKPKMMGMESFVYPNAYRS